MSLKINIDHALIGRANNIVTSEPVATISMNPVVLEIEGRPLSLQVKVTAPSVGENLPVILLSHGQGKSNNLSSLHGYGPLVDFWAAHGFVVIQPTHLSSNTIKLDVMNTEDTLFWRSRVEDMSAIIDKLDIIEGQFLHIKGRMDKSRIAVVGHSMGGHTAGMILGAQLKDPKNGEMVNLRDERVATGILLTPPGSGGKDLTEFVSEKLSFFRHPSFSQMSTQALIVVGEDDVSPHLTVRGADWHSDPYHLSTGPKHLLTLKGSGHLLGGISGYDALETTDEDLERVGVVQRMTWTYLMSTLYSSNESLMNATIVLDQIKDIARLEYKDS